MRSTRPAAALLGILVALAGPEHVGRAIGPATQADTSVKAVIAAAARYVAGYQQQLTFLLADETARQQVYRGASTPDARRVTTGELFVTYLAADRAWLSIHDVAQVDGAPVSDREDLRTLLSREPVAGVARRLVEANARFNIGSILRNFNEPTLALLVLEPDRRSRFKFSHPQVEHDGGTDLVTVGFKETDAPTLVRGVDGRDVYSTGELTVEAGTGRIHRTSIRFTYQSIIARLTTTYASDDKLDLWVPVALEERYERTEAPRETITCEASYTDWRRFEVRVRIR